MFKRQHEITIKFMVHDIIQDALRLETHNGNAFAQFVDFQYVFTMRWSGFGIIKKLLRWRRLYCAGLLILKVCSEVYLRITDRRPAPPVLTVRLLVKNWKADPISASKDSFILNSTCPQVHFTSTCWPMEPHSFYTCNFLVDHRKQPLSHLSVFHSLCIRM